MILENSCAGQKFAGKRGNSQSEYRSLDATLLRASEFNLKHALINFDEKPQFPGSQDLRMQSSLQPASELSLKGGYR